MAHSFFQITTIKLPQIKTDFRFYSLIKFNSKLYTVYQYLLSFPVFKVWNSTAA